MTLKISKIAICCSLFFMLPCSAVPQQKVNGSDISIRKSLHEFVQNFYDWYVPKALSDHAFPAWDFALKYRKRAFSPELFRALKEDSDAQAKATDLVGLDFDPFLNSQDPCEHYEAGGSNQVGNEYRIRIYPSCSGQKSNVPTVIAELVRNDRQWVFVNFLYPDQMKQYPDSADLLSNLKILRDDRAKSRRSKTRATN